VGPAFRNPSQELVEGCREITATGDVAWMKSGKLEHHEPDVRSDRLARSQERGGEQLGVEKVLVGLARPRSESRQIGELFESDLVGDLEAEKEVGRHLRQQLLELPALGKAVVGAVH